MPRAKMMDGKPKGRMSAYAFFVQTCREEYKKTNPNENVIFSEFSRKCADRWKIMDEEEKQPFYNLADKDKVRYDSEMSGYNGPRGIRGGRRSRQRKDPNAPKRALSAFFWFCGDERPKVRAIFPNMGIGEVAKEMGLRWSTVSQEIRAKCDENARKDKARYQEEMKMFKSGNFTPGLTRQQAIMPDIDDEDDDGME